MDTKQRILDEALTLFSEKGYANVFVGDIAERVGIKAPSLYKHYKNKRAIFDAIVELMNTRFAEQAKALNINGTTLPLTRRSTRTCLKITSSYWAGSCFSTISTTITTGSSVRCSLWSSFTTKSSPRSIRRSMWMIRFRIRACCSEW